MIATPTAPLALADRAQASDAWRKSAIVAGLLAASTAVRWVLNPLLPVPSPFTAYLIAIVAVAWFCGTRWAYGAVVCSLFLALFLWTPPEMTLHLAKVGDLFDVAVWAVVAVFIVWTLGAWQRATAVQAELAARLQAQSELLGSQAVALRESEATLRAHSELLEATVAHRTETLTETIAELESFSYSVSHNLRSPLRAMQSYAQLALESDNGGLPEKSREYLRRIEEAARRMDVLVQDLVIFNRAGAPDAPAELLDVGALVDELVRQHPEWLSRGGAVHVASPAGPRVCAIRTGLLQVLAALLSNAAKFVAPGVVPDIRVGIALRDGNVRITVGDNGVGMPAEFLPRLFKPFARGHSERDYPGRGIGLAIARKTVVRMGGMMGLERTSGAGSVFWLELPVRPPA